MTHGVEYRVEHRTVYGYSAPVTLSHQRMHLTPRPVPFQRVRSHEIRIEPEAAGRLDAEDAFGNPLVEVTIESAHRKLDVIARTLLEVRGRELPRPDATPPWETVRDGLRYRAGWRADDATSDAVQYLFESTHVRVKRELRAYAERCFTPGRPVLAAAAALMSTIHRDFRFDPKATTVSTPVMKVYENRRGVCQDFAHFMISCLRSLGLAARYMSGYLVTTDATLTGATASHAWVALHVPPHGWVELDPTNDMHPDVKHILIGWGRDFADVTPLRGVINAACEQSLEVKVSVTPVA